MKKILYVNNNHPRNSPGGAEIYAYELYEAVREAGEFEPIFVAKVGPPTSADKPFPGTRFSLGGRDPNDYYIYTEIKEFDRLFWNSRRKRLYIEDWREFLHIHRPDVVHFQHILFLGYDMIRETRRTLPDAAIVYTLHEFVPICFHQGQMVRTETLQLCHQATPRRCHECFPETSAQNFFLRERWIKSAFELVDQFITPSAHARQRYIEWGLDAEKVIHLDCARVPLPSVPEPPDAGQRGRLGFFGQITKFKGVDVLLDAIRILKEEELGVQLLLRGANLERTPPAFRAKFEAQMQEVEGLVHFGGRYEQSQLPALLSDVDWVVVPSIWWETGPLVIQEAFTHRRPVIASNIGSMLERVDDGVNGLQFQVGDAYSLADAIRRAVTTPGLWDRLRENIVPPPPMSEHAKTITDIYSQLLDRRGGKLAA